MLSNDSTDSDEGSSSDSEEEIDDDNEHTSSIKRSKMEYKTLNIGSRNRQQSDSDVLERPSDNESSDNEDQENENEEEYQRSLFHRNRNDTQKSNERLQPYYSRTLGRYNDSSVLDPVESFEERSPRKSVSATKSISHDEATLLDIMKKPNERYKYYTNIDDEPNAAETEYDEFYRTKSVDPSTDTQSKSADFSAWINRFQSLPDLDASFELNHTAFRENIPSSPLGSPKMISGSRIDTITTIINGASQQAKSSPVKQQQQSKIPIRPPSLSQSRSRSRSPSHSPTTRKKTMNDANNADRTIRRQTSPTSKIPVLIKTQQQPPIEKVFPKNDLPVTEKGAFHFFTSNEKLNDEPIVSNIFEKDETHNKEQNSKVTASSFLPINHKKTAVETKQSTNSTAYRFPTRNAISANGSYKSKTTTNVTTDLTMIDPRRLTSQQYSLDDSDDTLSIENESATELVMKLKEEKRHCKKTVTILNQLHENYGQLLEKYAQAENTIDQLRFQPKLYDNSTPPANTIEGSMHFIHQKESHTFPSKLTPNSVTSLSIRQVTSSTATAKTDTSPNSATIEGDYTSSVFFDEAVPQRIIVQELSTPETIKLDLLIQTKTLGEKMRSFLTLMDANQLSLTEQKQVYESIKQDYEKLLKTLNNAKNSDGIRRLSSGSDLQDIDLDTDLNSELETMKQLLKEIVKRITENLLGKASSESEGANGISARGSQSSAMSTRSSLINHGELMDQYQKLLNAVNASDRKGEMKSLLDGLDHVSGKLRKAMSQSSYNSPRSEISHTEKNTRQTTKPYICTSGNSDDEQCSTPEREGTLRRMESASFGLENVDLQNSISRVERMNQADEQRQHVRGTTSKHVSMDGQTPKKRQKKGVDNRQNTLVHDKKRTQYEEEEEAYNSLDDLSRTRRQPVRRTPIGEPYNREERSPTSNNKYNQKRNKHEVNKSSTSPTMSRWRGARTSDHDSGIGSVANTTKLSRETFLQDRSTTDNLDESIEYYQTNKSTDDELFHSSSHTKELIPHQNLLSKTRSPGLKKKSRYQSLTDLTKEARKYYHSDNGRKYPKKIKSPAKRSNSVNIYLSNTDDEEGLHSVTSSRSSGSGAESSDSLYYHHEYSKHGKNGFTRQSRKYSTSSKALRHESDFDDNNLYRRKPSGHSDLNQSDIETRITGSFENLHDSNELYHKDHLSYLHWAPSRQSSKNRLHRQVLAKHLRRSHSDQNIPLNKIPPTSYYYRPQTAPSSDRYVNMGRQRQSSDRRQQQHTYSSFYDDNRSRKSVSFPPTSIYSSSRSPPNLQNNNRISTSIPSTTSQATFVTKNPTSVDIDQRCVHRSPLVNTAQMYQQPLRHQVLSQPIPYSIRQEKPIPSTSNGTLYLDSKTGIIYRYVTNENITPVNNQINPKLIPLVTSDINTQKPLSRCTLCGSSTYHNHSQQQTILSPTYQSQRNNRSTNGLDDGYESEERKNHHHGNRRRVAVHGVLYESHDNSYESSSDADLNDIDYEALDETYERARIVQNRSHNLSRYISRQIKLVLTS